MNIININYSVQNMQNNVLGPKLILSRTLVDDTEDIPEEPDDFDTIIIEKKIIKYKPIRE